MTMKIEVKKDWCGDGYFFYINGKIGSFSPNMNDVMKRIDAILKIMDYEGVEINFKEL